MNNILDRSAQSVEPADAIELSTAGMIGSLRFYLGVAERTGDSSYFRKAEAVLDALSRRSVHISTAAFSLAMTRDEALADLRHIQDIQNGEACGCPHTSEGRSDTRPSVEAEASGGAVKEQDAEAEATTKPVVA